MWPFKKKEKDLSVEELKKELAKMHRLLAGAIRKEAIGSGDEVLFLKGPNKGRKGVVEKMHFSINVDTDMRDITSICISCYVKILKEKGSGFMKARKNGSGWYPYDPADPDKIIRRLLRPVGIKRVIRL